ncbi:ferritin-like domain-containing protein [Hygrophoropsis aurantiaca]|uniref:Ferritin-like domain-containing protein n=1 Tax=Hygrophoropsis aurantiaca TaxID=72124 RepID=A0ACB8AAD9_9AGAM|nr:ferritin-like domain-containing protein [Hygrophoropsis aurantiaca]
MSDFDFQSFNLALNQEYIELDLFHYGLAKFSPEEFEEAGLSADYQFLIEYMADQEVGHAKLISDIIYPNGAKQCQYQYPFNTVREFIDFCQKLTRWGESGVYGFLPHLDNRAPAELLINSITTEARQQMIFRQFEGLFPMAVYFIAGIPQAWAWTLLAPYLVHCPAENPHIEWQNFPALDIVNNPSGIRDDSKAAVSTNVSALSYPGMEVQFKWENPGKTVSYDGKYTTSTSAGAPKYALWVSQLNSTYTPLYDIKDNCASTKQPDGRVFGDGTAPIWNDTMFIALTDDNVFITPYNISLVNPHIVAGPAIYQAG